MKIIKSFFENSVKLIELKKFQDSRGFFYENFNESKFRNLNLNTKFIQDNISFSKNKGVIRGLHFQSPPVSQIKLISVLKGKILDVFVDIRKNSSSYGKYEKIILSENLPYNLFIPDGFAHGFSVLEDKTLVLYKTNNLYSFENEKTIIYNDKSLNIDWEISEDIIISDKDKNGIEFKKFDTPFIL